MTDAEPGAAGTDAEPGAAGTDAEPRAAMTDAAEAGQSASTWTPTQYARNGGVQIAYDTLAGSEGDPLLLVMGLAVSRFWWPTGLCQEFARQGFAVARYDQRDAGQSTRLPDTGGSNPFVAVARRR